VVLVERGILRHDQLARVVAERFGLDFIDLTAFDLDMGAVNLVGIQAAKRYQALPVGFTDDGALLLAMANPTNVLTIDDVGMMTGRRIRPAAASVEDLNLLLARLARMDESIEDIIDDEAEDAGEQLSVDEADSDAPVIKLVHSIVAEAIQQGASDIHVNPEEGDTRVLFRVDGVLAPAATIKRRMAMGVVSRIKIMADLDISEKRLPQDGRIGIVIEGRRIDVRVAIVPLVDGESAVLRILDAGREPLSLDDLGMSPDDHARLESSLHLTHGGILATGPTGSGKTTSLYALMALVRSPEKTLTTIEDPVEYRLSGVNQIQVSERSGLTFATGLRAIVRADPDVIMVGEIRDRESAHIAIDAALTGHLVLSTLHTNDAPGAPMRLVDMGIEPYLVAAAINCVIAQRLARRVCISCRKAVRVPGQEVGLSGGEVDIFEAVGCARCRHTGYRGRVGLYEVMNVTDEIRAAIVARSISQDIARIAIAQGMQTLRDDGFAKIRAGSTTLVELKRVLG
jgi:type IV pilus assembly protein PilB